ncbi:calcium/proton exchanger [Alkalihalobacillus sp. BA299]|uniref:calcium/proton exchanger n=1 Tax=Alkalihalobacillus sp. BA299 TaxID=2815938 RepID=UPI001ADA3174|nr:calcium/proton exchanger [Alkalihalobacillus sp. BA299]
MQKFFLIAIIIGIPLSFLGDFLHWSHNLMFAIYAATIIALATFMGRSTESIAVHVGERLGGLLNATFGNAVELIISIFALKVGYISIVLASLTGAVIGNLLLVCGLSFFVGGLKYKRQKFNVHDSRHNSGLLMMGVIIAFVFPHIFASQTTHNNAMVLSVSVAVVLILLYMAALLFRLVTHRGVYPNIEEGTEHEVAEWTKRKSFIILLLSTIGVAFVSEKLVHTFETVAESFGWSEVFIGVIVVAIVGNAAEHASAIWMAYKNKMNASIEIAIGSSIQIAMFVTPVLVLLSLTFGNPMPLVFTVPELIAMVLAALLTIIITNDGDSNWFEGATLLAAYAIMGIGFYLI